MFSGLPCFLLVLLIPAFAAAQQPSQPSQGEFAYKQVSGEWITAGRRMPDGGFMCASSHIISGKPMTMFTGLQLNPAYVHQNIFMPTTLTEGTVLSATITFPDGIVSEPRQAHVTAGMIVVPLDIILLKSVGDAMAAEKPLTITASGAGAENEVAIFTMNGAPQAAIQHTECIKTFYTPQQPSATEPTDTMPPATRGY